MQNPGYTRFVIPLSLALAVAACGGDSPDDGQAPSPAVVAPAAGEATPQPGEAAPVPDPDGSMPELPTDEYGMPPPWAVAAQMGAGMGALAEGCGMADSGGFDSLDADALREIEALGADMEAFEALWTQTYTRTRRDFAAGTDAERAGACAELEEMQRLSEQADEG